MSSISIRWDRRAVKEIKAVSPRDRSRLLRAIEHLTDDPLRGAALSGEWRGLRRLRVGAYRVIYAFDGSELLISVIRIGHRRQVDR